MGNADDKNPKGQAPNGSDHNAGYECDRNHGVGRTNPAHTGCTTSGTASTSTGSGKVSKPKSTTTPAPPTPVGCPAGTMPTGDGGCVASEVIVPPVLDPGPPANNAFDVKPAALGLTPATEVLGVSFVRALSSEVGVLGSELGSSSAGGLPVTGVNSTPDLTAMALALVIAGTLFRRLGHRRPTGSEA